VTDKIVPRPTSVMPPGWSFRTPSSFRSIQRLHFRSRLESNESTGFCFYIICLVEAVERSLSVIIFQHRLHSGNDPKAILRSPIPTVATMVASAVFITDLQGKAIISRNYRGDVPLTKSIERFAKYLVEVEEEAKKPIFHVDSNGDVETGDEVGASGAGGETYVYVSVSTESIETGVGRNPFSLLMPPLGLKITHILIFVVTTLFSTFSIPTCICAP
jgi:hypothetical protein